MNTSKTMPELGSAAPHRLPSAFGRFTVIGSQHQQVAARVDELRRASEALRSGDDGPERQFEAAALLSSWRAELTVHFATEESDSYFGVVAADHPDLIARIAELRADHTAMLETIEQLVTLAMTQTRGSNLGQRMEHLIQQLRIHEQAEAMLVEDYLHGSE